MHVLLHQAHRAGSVRQLLVTRRMR